MIKIDFAKTYTSIEIAEDLSFITFNSQDKQRILFLLKPVYCHLMIFYCELYIISLSAFAGLCLSAFAGLVTGKL